MTSSSERVLIVLNGGVVPWDDLSAWVETATHVIAADGGANLLAAHGFTANTILGDLDSIAIDLGESFPDAEVVRLWDQERTDFQKALDFAIEELGASSIAVIGAEGNRLDHTLAALAYAAQRSAHASIRFPLATAVVHVVCEAARFRVRVGSVVSLIPLTQTRVIRSSGLQWPPEGVLEPGGRTSISNRAVEEEVALDVEGCLAVFIERSEGDVAW